MTMYSTAMIIPTFVRRIGDPAPEPVTLAEWDAVRIHRSTFILLDHSWAVEKRPYAAHLYCLYHPGRGAEAPRTADTLQEVAFLLTADGETPLRSHPSEVLGTIAAHTWGDVPADMVSQVREMAARGHLLDCCRPGHLLPPDLTELEARLLLLSDFPGHCTLNGREPWGHGTV
jgi:hypothetical protein